MSHALARYRATPRIPQKGSGLARCEHGMIRGICVVDSCWAFDGGPAPEPPSTKPEPAPLPPDLDAVAYAAAKVEGWNSGWDSFANDLARMRTLRALRRARPGLSRAVYESTLSGVTSL